MEFAPMGEVAEDVLRDYYERLMALSFAPAELMTYEEVISALRGGATWGLVALDDGRPVGGLIVEDCVGGALLLLAYVVVSPEVRGQGIGLELIRRAVGDDDRLVLAEIEDPRFHAADPQTGDPVARSRFYDRMGSQLLPIPYFQPSLRPGSPRVPDLLLITIPSARPRPDHIESELVVAFLDEYVRECEGEAVVAHDAEYLALRRAASATESLPLVPLGDLHLARPAAG